MVPKCPKYVQIQMFETTKNLCEVTSWFSSPTNCSPATTSGNSLSAYRSHAYGSTPSKPFCSHQISLYPLVI